MTQPRWVEFLTKRRGPKPVSVYADYSARMLSAAIDLLVIMIAFRRVFAWIDGKIKPNLEQAMIESRLREVPAEQAGADAFAQAAAFFDRLISGDVLFYVLLNHGSAILLIVVAMILMQVYFGTTPGRWVMGLRLVTDDLQSRPNASRVCLRYAVCILSTVFLMLGLVWIMFSKKQQSWHDIAANTYVINMRPKGWYWGKVKAGFAFLKNKIMPPDQSPS